MIRLLALPAAAILAASLAAPASAQVVGTYSGTTSDGTGQSVTVTTDAATGLPEITSAGFNFSAPCKGAVYKVQSGWGFAPNLDVTGGAISTVSYDNYFQFTWSLAFSADGSTATGTLKTVVPTLYPTNGPATKALVCRTKALKMKLTLQPPPAAAAAAASRPGQHWLTH